MPATSSWRWVARATPKAIAGLVEELDTACRVGDDVGILVISAKLDVLGFNFQTVTNGVYHMSDRDHNH
jgi:hypothetical protein